MAKARMLPSGAWQTRPTKTVNGVKISKSFTVSLDEVGGSSKKARMQSEMLAKQWMLETETSDQNGLTISQILEKYIKDREKVLSPRTIYDYRRYVPFFENIKDIYMSDLKTSHVQALVNEWSVSVTKKTITNRLSLLFASLDYADCDKKFKLRLPKYVAKKVQSPDVQDVLRLLENASADFKPIIALAAFGSLRRGEICALKGSDISRDMNTIFVHADVVQSDKGFIYKNIPKTSGSVRVVDLEQSIMDLLPRVEDPDDFIFKLNPNQISKKYDKLREKCGIDANFHSLRHFAASFRSDIGIPQKYIEEVGGWTGESEILKTIYDNGLTSSRKKYTQMTNDYIRENFEKVLKSS